MKIPVIRGVIDRRILVNYRVDPQVLARLLPAPFRPKIVRGMGLVGICLIRLKQIRPAFLPAWCGISSENAAHRMAAEWDDHGGAHSGVYIRRRDTSSRLNSLAGGRLFPGVAHHAKFTVRETADEFAVAVRSDDGDTSLSVRCHRAQQLTSTSLFQSMEEASSFFETGSLGYSDCADVRRFQGMELRCRNWLLQPLDVDEVQSSFFDNEQNFPKGSIEFDCAVLMQNIAHEWHCHPDLCGT